ncbi:MAG: hypothetical protein Q8M26_01990 [Pseudolabrys sp.]|nr:hypothetical protein [Pseudolabrys sp.]
MGFFQRIFGRKLHTKLAAGRGWTIDAVGELNYQQSLQTLYQSLGGTDHDVKTTAILVPEQNNQFDSNAVRVEISRRTVGYLSKGMATEYRAAVGTASGSCGAKIVGGFLKDDGTTAYFGVKLNVSWPPRAKDSSK